jgi:tRNA (adenine57-N1/adenine58-N1)-methyltransferase catalytic subunit
MKILLDKDSGKRFLFRKNEDFNTKWGAVSKEDYDKEKTETPQKRKMFILPTSFSDLYRKIKRKAQLVPLETLGRIAIEVAMNKDSIIVDAGTGSGASSCYFAHLCKQVHTFDIEEEHIEISKDNAKFLELDNISFNKCDIVKEGFRGIEDNSIDVVFLDFVSPWEALAEAHRVLKRGSFLVVYNPQITQMVKLREEYDKLNLEDSDKFISFKTIEIIERMWKIEEQRARPSFNKIGHSGFVTFMRKV